MSRYELNLASLPVAVIGAGPIGLAAAAHLVAKGETPLVLEVGENVGANMRKWAHVRVFSPWHYNIDKVAKSLLETTNWTAPEPDYLPTGGEIVEQYLKPLAELPQLKPHIHFGTKVMAVTRKGFDKLKTSGREEAPFLLHVQTASGEELQFEAKAVIDASGSYSKPNPLGASGTFALGERALASKIFYGIPEVLHQHRERYAGKRVLVVGSGHSAFNALLDLAELATEEPDTEIIWAIRREQPGQIYGGERKDQLPARGDLGGRLRHLVENSQVKLVTGFKVAKLSQTEQGIVVSSEEGETLPTVDEIIATTGFRPDLSILEELRLEYDAIVESTAALAPLIDPNVHSCGTVPPHGAEELKQPEKDFFVVGMKSYGRAPTFLMLTGYEQVRSVVSALTGDWQAARRVELELPETGVCSVQAPSAIANGQAAAASSCCGSAEPSSKGAGREQPLIQLVSKSSASPSCGVNTGSSSCGVAAPAAASVASKPTNSCCG
jgi:thioredoxin reductase